MGIALWAMMSLVTEERLVWHYTTGTGLVGMLTGHKLWATSLSFMNDPGEADYAASLLREAARGIHDRAGRYILDYLDNSGFDGFEQGFSERFVVCASAASDSLDLWRSYGPTDVAGTFAVGLDRTAPLGVLDVPEAHSSLVSVAGWCDVRYESPGDSVARIRNHLEAGIDEIEARFGPSPSDRNERGLELWRLTDDQFSDLVAVGKHAAYQSEREARLVWKVNCSRAPFHIRPGRFGPVAYVELTSVPKWGDTANHASRLPIREIIIWPEAPRAARNGVAAALRRGGFRHDHEDPILQDSGGDDDDHSRPVRIRRSDVPFV